MIRNFFRRIRMATQAISDEITHGLLVIAGYVRNSETLAERLCFFVNGLRYNNNCRANTFLLLVAAFGLLWLIFFGITPTTPGMSTEDIAFYSAAGENTPWFSDWGFSERLKWAGWKFWWLCFALSTLYRLIAWRDEVHRAWETTRQHMAEVRRAIQDLTPEQPTVGATRLEYPSGLSTWLRVFFREFVAAITGDYIARRA